jgi:Meckel syndrome type 1 protein
LAGSRAAASVSLTIGVAFVTLLVAGGILAGPSILDCSHQAGGIGACLRAKVQDAGLLPDAPSSSAPAVSLQTSTPAVETRPQGWLEANANEYEAPASTGSAELTAPNGSIGAGGKLTPKPVLEGEVRVSAPSGTIAAKGKPLPALEATAQVALAQPAGRLDAAGRTPVATSDRAQIALVEPVGRLDASGTVVARPDTTAVDLSAKPNSIGASGMAGIGTLQASADVAVAAPTGAITLNGLGAPGTSASALADPILSKGAAASTGSITSAATTHGTVALEAEAEIPQTVPTPVATAPVLPALPVPKAAPKPRPPKAATVTTPKAGPKRVFKADPRYPNVIALPPPPPIAAANSSFATLELR